MPVEIHEVLLRTTVRDNQEACSSEENTKEGEGQSTPAHSVEQVMEVFKRKNER